MSRSKPRDLCWACKVQWEQERRGEEYLITGRDMKEAKEFLEACGELPSPDSIVSHVRQFCRSDFGGWKTLNYPLWALFRNWNTYNPPPAKAKTTAMVECDVHGVGYPIGGECPECRKELNAMPKIDPKEVVEQIKELGKKMSLTSQQGR